MHIFCLYFLLRNVILCFIWKNKQTWILPINKWKTIKKKPNTWRKNYLINMNSFAKYFRALSVLFTLFTAMSDACWTKRTYLTLTNDLGPGLQLSLHCKSGSVDPGQQHLAPQGSWSFDFCSSFWGVTSYFCNVVWNGGNKWFDVYTGERDSFICGECGWSIRPTGPCRDHGGKVDCFPWNS